jgi:hypothetical protein
MLKVGFDRSHNDTRLYPEQAYAHQVDANPRVDDNSFVENPVENVREGRLARHSYDMHQECRQSGRSVTLPIKHGKCVSAHAFS